MYGNVKELKEKYDSDEYCFNCRYGKVMVDKESDEVMEVLCRRNPPKLVVVNRDNNVSVHSLFPKTRPDEWCGEYK